MLAPELYRTSLNTRLRAPASTRARYGEVQNIPGLWVNREQEIDFPWSAHALVQKRYGIPPAAWRGRKPFRLPALDPAELGATLRDVRTPREYQLHEVNRYLRLGGGTIWTSPGAGKTYMGLQWGLTLGRRYDAAVLYVTRACLRGQVEEEVRRWFRDDAATPVLLMPPSQQRAHAQDDLHELLLRAQGVPVVIVGWEQLRDETFLDAVPLHARLGACSVIFDEIQFAKNETRVKHQKDLDGEWVSEVQQTIAGAALLTAEAIPCRLGLTATPGDTDRDDLWAQLALIEPHGWGKSPRKFKVRYCGAVRHPEAGGKVPAHVLTTNPKQGGRGITHSEEFWLRVDPVASRIPYSVTHGHLPPLHRRLDVVEVVDQVKPSAELNRKRRELMRTADYGDPSARAALIELDYEEAAERVMPRALETLRQYRRVGKGKVILFTGRKALADKAARQAERAGFEVFVLHGDVSDAEFNARLRAYNEHSGPCVAVGTPDKLGTGFNMPDTDLVLFAMLPNRVGLLEQAERRADRINRTRPLQVIYMVPKNSQIEKDLRRIRDNAQMTADVHKGSGLDQIEELFGMKHDRDALLKELAAVLATGLARDANPDKGAS